MTSTTNMVAVLVTVAMVIHQGLGVRIDINPETYTDQTAANEKVTISCHADQKVDCDRQQRVVLEVRRHEGEAMASVRLRHGGSHVTSSSKSIQVHGHIREQCGHSYIRVTLSTPRVEDSGKYVCTMFYHSKSGAYTEERASKRLTVEVLDIHDLVNKLMSRVSEMEAELKVEKTRVSDELRALSNATDALTTTTDALTTTTDALTTTTDALTTTTDALTTTTDALTNTTDALTTTTDALNLEKSIQRSEIDEVSDKVSGLQDEVDQQAAKMSGFSENVAYTVAFSAALSSGTELPKGSVVVFDKVVTNIGGGYDPKTGVFTVPTHGVYVFYLVMRTAIGKGNCYNSGCIVGVYLMADDTQLARAIIEHPSDASDDLDSQSSVTSVVELKKGVKVKAKTDDKMRWNSAMSTMFSGYMIKAY